MTRVAALLSPHPESRAGGVERFCGLVADVLNDGGWQAQIVGPSGEPGRWAYRTGLGPLRQSRSAGAAAAAVHPQLIVSNGFLGALGPRATRIHVYHGTLAGYTKTAVGVSRRERARWALGGGAAEALAARGATTVAVSDRVADEVRRHYRATVDAVIPNGVDTDLFAARDRGAARARLDLPVDERIALYVGRLDPGKGAAEMPAACAAAGWTLAVAGPDAPPAPGRHLGVLAHEALAWAYAACDAVLFPTRYEGCSYVVLEALAAGVPVFTTEVGWLPTLLAAVPEYRALLAAPGDVGAFTRLLRDGVSEAQVSAVAHASAFVREHNSLPAWAAKWRGLVGATS
jgi:glycosyltransferase involved in cell wall biosynthesis